PNPQSKSADHAIPKFFARIMLVFKSPICLFDGDVAVLLFKVAPCKMFLTFYAIKNASKESY
uniref:hypothetical protein n=1 Tax=Helicobacter bizzozeronii TaxID=56877 RepID=UPI001F2E00B6